ncbi:MAG: hypothetical protein L0Z53_22375 [Acidobacteriales bacterium]|nr:hypothetical protein [Terriglobales bacterium]
MTVPIIQAWLIRRRRFEWHRILGKLSLLLAPILVVSGLHMVQIMVLKVPGLSQTLRMKFAFLDISAMLFFVLFLSLALRSIYRGEVKKHAQYMSCTVLIALEPGLERLLLYRIPNIGSFDVALNVALVMMAAIAAALLYSEWRSDRVRIPYVVILAFFVTVHLLLAPVSTSSTFQSFARWFATL